MRIKDTRGATVDLTTKPILCGRVRDDFAVSGGRVGSGHAEPVSVGRLDIGRVPQIGYQSIGKQPIVTLITIVGRCVQQAG